MKPRSPKQEHKKQEHKRKAISPLFFIAVPLLALGLVAQTVRLRDRLQAGRLLRQVELFSMAALARRELPRGLIPVNLRLLRQAEALDPTLVGVPIARGTQYLISGNGSVAVHAYREALALEPRPEVYLNLGRALLDAGEPEEARRQFDLAVRLDPLLAPLVPPDFRNAAP